MKILKSVIVQLIGGAYIVVTLNSLGWNITELRFWTVSILMDIVLAYGIVLYRRTDGGNMGNHE